MAPSPEAVKSARALLTKAKSALIGEAKVLELRAAVSSKRVTLPATPLSHPRQFALREQTQLPVATELVLRRIHFDVHPRSGFGIYLQRVDDPTRREYVSTLSFFSEGTEHHGAAEDTRVFDVTEELRALGFEGTGTFEVDVVFEATEPNTQQGFDPAESSVVVDEIEFRVVRDR
jgi:hypothetical protein